MDQKIIGKLSEMGLTRNEALIYYAALSLGPTSVLKISYESGIKRSTIYPILKSLIAKGLIQTQTNGIKQSFVAKNPGKLEIMVESHHQLLSDAMPKLSALYSNSEGIESFIKHYRGIDAIKSLFDKVLSELKISSFCYVISDIKKWQSILSSFYDELISSNVQVKKLEMVTPFKAYTIITPHKLIIMQTSAPYSATTIENQSIIDMNIEIFMALWNSTQEGADNG